MTLSEPISSVLGASWGDDNNIIFGTLGGLFRVPAAGETPVKLVKEGHGPQIFPQVLPGSKAVLFDGFPEVASLLRAVWRISISKRCSSSRARKKRWCKVVTRHVTWPRQAKPGP